MAAWPDAAEPTFVNGLAQNVFSANTADWIRGEGWVQSTTTPTTTASSDRIHFDITRPKETATGLKVPMILEASPYYANLGPNSNWSVDLELGATPAARPFQPNFATKNTSPKIATTFEAPVAAARLRGHARGEPGHRVTPTAARPTARRTRTTR